jgi:uncharacterized membrane protein YfcA
VGNHRGVTIGEAAIIAIAGVWAGMINTVVGSGTLVTFPVLLALGFPPLTANVSNGLGLVPGSLTGAIGYRRELTGLRGRVLRLAVPSVLGALLGALLLLVLPSAAFDEVVPVLVALAVVLVVIGPWVSKRVAARDTSGEPRTRVRPALVGATFGTGVYGGYFGAAQGVLLVAFLGLGLDVPLSAINGLKNIAVLSANVAAGVVFAFLAPIHWGVVGLLAIGSVVGAWLGAHLGRRLPPAVFRMVVVVIGYVVGVRMLLT